MYVSLNETFRSSIPTCLFLAQRRCGYCFPFYFHTGPGARRDIPAYARGAHRRKQNLDRVESAEVETLYFRWPGQPQLC